jgi:hypothetical protein
LGGLPRHDWHSISAALIAVAEPRWVDVAQREWVLNPNLGTVTRVVGTLLGRTQEHHTWRALG